MGPLHVFIVPPFNPPARGGNASLSSLAGKAGVGALSPIG